MTRLNKTKSFFSKWILCLCIVGLLLNIILANVVSLLNIPLYIDNVGSVLVAALGGPLPGIIVGFLSNVLNSLDNPISLYYGFLTVIIAALASFFSKRGFLKKWWGCLLASLSFTLIGGSIGSLLTWWLFGGQISGTAAPIAFYLNHNGVAPFISQLLADTLIDIPDKLITVGIVFVVLHFYPKKLYGKFQLSYIYEKNGTATKDVVISKGKYGHSINRRLTKYIVSIIAVVGIFALFIGSQYYRELLRVNSETSAQYASSRAAQCIDGDKVYKQFSEKIKTNEYLVTEKKLSNIYQEITDVSSIYVYVINNHGCYSLYNIDSLEKNDTSIGARVENNPDIYNRIDEFTKGEGVSPGYGNAPFGTLVSAYTPIYDSQGDTVAYAGADINQQLYIQKYLIYIVEFASFLFAIILIAIILMRRYVNKRISYPIVETIRLTRELDKISPEEWTSSEIWKQKTEVKTDDELEELYRAVTDGKESVSNSVRARMESEQKLLQTKELERINTELETAIKKADTANLAKSEFLSRMSHDMRTPMNGILGLTALLKDRTDPNEIRADIDQIEMSAKYLLSLINDTLDMSKIESGKMILHPEPVSSEELFGNIIATASILANQKGVQLVTEFPSIPHGKWVPVVADASRVEQVFINLISNAVKFTPKGGTVTLHMETIAITDDTVTDKYVVSDNGIGMSEEFQKHLFEPFSQECRLNTSSESGTGLGLAIVKQIVDFMNGSVQVESKIDEGTAFTVQFTYPRYKGELEDKSDVKSDISILKGKRVLLCEDHPVNAQIAIRLLDKQEMIVEWANNGQIGVDMMNNSKEYYYDAILMDIRMPVMDGIEAAKKIRSLPNRSDCKSVPIIAMTANAFDDDKEKTREAGMNAHLAKPVVPELLYETLSTSIQMNK